MKNNKFENHSFKKLFKNIGTGVILTATLACSNAYAELNKINFEITEKTLNTALNDFADQASVQVMFASSINLSEHTVSLNGSYTLFEALNILLTNSGLEYVEGEGGRSFAIRPIQPEDTALNSAKLMTLTMVEENNRELADDNNLASAQNSNSNADSAGSVMDKGHATIEEVIITAQKRAQNVQDVGIAVTVFGAENIKNFQFTDPIDVGGQTPGLNIRYTDGNTNPVINIRGIGLNDNNSNNNPSAAVHIDDVYISSSAYLSFPLFDLERIEVLKGPQGTLFGRNSTGGSVNFFTKKPTEEPEGYVDVSLGNFGAYRIEGAVSGAITENLLGRLAFTTIQSDGHQTNIGTIAAGTAGDNAFTAPFPDNPATEPSQHGADDVTALRLTLDWNPTENFNLTLSGHVMRDNSDNWIQRLSGPDKYGFVQPGDKSTVSSEFSPARDADGLGFVVKSETDFETMQLITISGYETYDRVSAIDVAGPSRFFTREQDENLWQFTQEVRLQSDATEGIFWTVGAFYSKDRVDSANGLVFGEPGSFSPTTLLTAYIQTGNSFAVFGHAEYELSEKLKVIGGLRYTNEQKTYDGGSRDADPYGLSGGGISHLPPGGAGIQTVSDYSANDVSGKIGLDWTPMDDFLLYASFSRGFKSGGFDGSTFTGTPLEAKAFRAEIVLAYEVGFKSTLMEDRFQLNGAAFYYDYNDLQVSLRADFAPGLQGTTRVNAGAARILGFELEAIAYPAEGLTMQGGISYLDTEVTDVSGIVVRATDVSVGNRVPDAPEFTANASARYEVPLNETMNFAIAADVDYRSVFFTNINNTENYTGGEYTLVNAKMMISYGESWEFSVWARNLLDNEYVISRDLVKTTSPFPLETYGKPRTYGASVRFSF